MVRIKRKTRIAVHIEERLVVRSRQHSGEAVPVPEPPAGASSGCLGSSPVSRSQKQKDKPSCNEQ